MRCYLLRTIHQKPQLLSKVRSIMLDNGHYQKFKETYQVANDIVQVEGYYHSRDDAEAMIKKLQDVIPDIPLKSGAGKASITYSVVQELPTKPLPFLLNREMIFRDFEEDENVGDWESIPGMKQFE